ncbi:MAG: ATP synthase F1 subunit delta [Kofleriaceae bacterium]|nr:ATP synthase F1 subunit delta [Kofleriaceae bacterium]
MLSRRYAKAIFDIGSQHGNLDKLGAELRTIAQAMKQSPELAATLSSPAIRRSDRRKVIDAILQRINAQPLTKNTIYLLLDGERLGYLPVISREVDAMIEEKAGRVSAEVVSAKALDPAQLSQITAALEKLSGKKVSISRREDPDLLGGIVAKVGDTVYDGSLRTQLRTLRDELSK